MSLNNSRGIKPTKAISTFQGSEDHPQANSISQVSLDFLINNRTNTETNRYFSKDLSQLLLHWTHDIMSQAIKFDLLEHFQAEIPKSRRTPDDITPLLEKWFRIFNALFFVGV
jgi:hypothetical protein